MHVALEVAHQKTKKKIRGFLDFPSDLVKVAGLCISRQEDH